MNIFTYLNTDENHLKELMWDVTNNYPEWTQDRVFESVKNVIDSVHAHIKKKNELVLSNVRDHESISDVLSKWDEQTSNIDETINSLIMIHVDEPGFEQLLIKLSKMVDNLISFSKDELYPAVRSVATEEELNRMNKHLDSLVLS
ncbi:hypothetical protein KF728_23660 [Candidatus Obscuribacterales bacterium]|nr:hypothetical protein [Candidatus Obscuribacterales bacterium]